MSPAQDSGREVPAPAEVTVSIDRLVVECPPGMRADHLNEALRSRLEAVLAERAGKAMPAPARHPRISASVRAGGDPMDYADRIARRIVERIWK